ncbi:hypothetical protein D9M69_548130 [compost metagenome]
MHPAAPFAARQLGVAFVGLGQQLGGVAQGDDGVEARIERVDAGERRLHHLAAGHVAGRDLARKFGGAELRQVVERHGACGKRRGRPVWRGARIIAAYGNKVARRLHQLGGNPQLQPLGPVEARDAAGVLAAHPGARGMGRHRPGRPQLVSHAPHARGPDAVQPGHRDAAVAAEHARHAARPLGRRPGRDRDRRAAHAGLHLLSLVGHQPARALRAHQEPSHRAQRA